MRVQNAGIGNVPLLVVLNVLVVSRGRTDAEADPGQCRRCAGGLDPQRPPDAPPPAAAAGGYGPETEDHADGRADRGAGVPQPRVPRAAHPGQRHSRTSGRRHLLRRHAEGRGHGLHPDRPGLLQPLRLGPALHLEDAGDRRGDPEQPRAALEAHATKVQTILSDNGREYCGRPEKHPYELFLQLEEIEHRTLLEEHLWTKGGTTWYETVEEMQKDLDGYIETYNTRRLRRGCGMEGRTPYEVFKAGIPTKPSTRNRKMPARKEVKPAA